MVQSIYFISFPKHFRFIFIAFSFQVHFILFYVLRIFFHFHVHFGSVHLHFSSL